MVRRQDRSAAIIAAILISFSFGCSRELPTSSAGSGLKASPDGTAPASTDAAASDLAGFRVLRDLPGFEAATGRRTEVDFETRDFQGLVLRDPYSLDFGFCSSPTCRPDPDNPDGGNIEVFLNPGGMIGFPRGTTAALLVVEGIGDNPFQLRATNNGGGSAVADGAGVIFGVSYLGFSSPAGISRIEVVDVGGTLGPLAVSAVHFGSARGRALGRQPAAIARP